MCICRSVVQEPYDINSLFLWMLQQANKRVGIFSKMLYIMQHKSKETLVVFLLLPTKYLSLQRRKLLGKNDSDKPAKHHLCKQRLSTGLIFHPEPTSDFRKKLHLDFPETLPPIQKPVSSSDGKFSLLPVLQPIVDQRTEPWSPLPQQPCTIFQMVISEHFWAKLPQQDTSGFKAEEDRQISKYPNWKHLLQNSASVSTFLD